MQRLPEPHAAIITCQKCKARETIGGVTYRTMFRPPHGCRCPGGVERMIERVPLTQK